MERKDRRSPFDLEDKILKESRRFSFFQAVRLLQLLDSKAVKVGKTGPLEEEILRFKGELSLGFPSSDIAKIEKITDKNDKAKFYIYSTFLSLYGTPSPLPTFYTEDLIAEAIEDETVTRDFLDIIHHRLFSFLYRCWLKYKIYLRLVEEKDEQIFTYLFSFIGLGTKGLENWKKNAFYLLRYAGIFTQCPKSSLGLKTILQDALKIPIEIIPMIKRNIKIPQDQRCFLGQKNCNLGENIFLGKITEDISGKFRIKIGPVSIDKFHRLLPKGIDYEKINFLTKMYIVEPLEYDLEIIIAKREIKTVCLGNKNWANLGYNTWIFSGTYEKEIKILLKGEYLW